MKSQAKAIVVLNESHTLKSEQQEIISAKYKSHQFLSVPVTGWTLEQMQVEIDKLVGMHYDTDWAIVVIFASPVPAMIKMCSECDELCERFYIFHNDNRNKRELPGGKIIYTVADTGWQLY